MVDIALFQHIVASQEAGRRDVTVWIFLALCNDWSKRLRIAPLKVILVLLSTGSFDAKTIVVCCKLDMVTDRSVGIVWGSIYIAEFRVAATCAGSAGEVILVACCGFVFVEVSS